MLAIVFTGVLVSVALAISGYAGYVVFRLAKGEG
jgi:hypothetical protein